jgi:Na+/citrate or Na+/malate symporter
MTDPDFVGQIQHVSRKTVQNSYGENILTDCTANTVGSVQPISTKDIQKIPEAMRIANMLTFFIKGTIVASAPGKYSDILIFQGQRFQVMTVNDWSAWGAGYCEGMCIAEIPSP